MTINWAEIEQKWRNKWQENQDFETNPNDKPKKFITVAYPYPNSPQHIGHGRTYTLADVHSRFYRMQGYNVLFPMGFTRKRDSRWFEKYLSRSRRCNQNICGTYQDCRLLS
jgi:leucyl-tRNA synthetase